ncbi:MAG: hypothetical protein LQ338_000322 [Usnochroma carphineum]|nr:MAG: hypothetical protein LQ338_000322 [Usnochroma carphineum]
MSRSRVVSIATMISLVLFFFIGYRVTRLPTFNFPQHLSDNAKAHEALRPLKTAVIIEGRESGNLVPLILHFSTVLGPEWPIKVFHSPENREAFSTSPAFQRQMSSGHITLQQLPSNITLNDHASISKFFADRWIYDQVAPARHILFFQTDSILCANSPRMVEDFLPYDFIGAPIDRAYGNGMNGGLSLRNRERVLEVLDLFNYTGDPADESEWEDQWFVHKMEKLPTGPNYEPGANLPTPEVALRFSVESIWHDQPFGLHQVSRWQSSHQEELEAWCPEYLLAGSAGFCKPGMDCWHS